VDARAGFFRKIDSGGQLATTHDVRGQAQCPFFKDEEVRERKFKALRRTQKLANRSQSSLRRRSKPRFGFTEKIERSSYFRCRQRHLAEALAGGGGSPENPFLGFAMRRHGSVRAVRVITPHRRPESFRDVGSPIPRASAEPRITLRKLRSMTVGPMPSAGQDQNGMRVRHRVFD